jgi:hypothetical protein
VGRLAIVSAHAPSVSGRERYGMGTGVAPLAWARRGSPSASSMPASRE